MSVTLLSRSKSKLQTRYARVWIDGRETCDTNDATPAVGSGLDSVDWVVNWDLHASTHIVSKSDVATRIER